MAASASSSFTLSHQTILSHPKTTPSTSIVVPVNSKVNGGLLLKSRRRRVGGVGRVESRAAVVRAAAVEALETTEKDQVVEKSVNTIRFLAIDAVEKANSGHPGLPMGCAPMGHILYDEVMRYNPKNPYWFNRDRFVLSAGHGCMLQYALLHLAGYDSVTVSLNNFVLVLLFYLSLDLKLLDRSFY